MSAAILSVYNKDGIVAFAEGLLDFFNPIIASGGTAKALREASFPVTDLSDLVGEQILGHRVVSLSRKVYAGILARAIEGDEAELTRIGFPRIGCVCVDMYPLTEAILKPDATRESVVEMTDIGGPTLLYAAVAKGGQLVISDPTDRPIVIERLKAGTADDEFRRRLALRARTAVIRYQAASAAFEAGELGLTPEEFFGQIQPRLLDDFYNAGIRAHDRRVA